MANNNDNDDWSKWRLLVLKDLERLDENIKLFDPKINSIVEQIQTSIDNKFDKLEQKLENDFNKRLRDLEVAMITLKVKASTISAVVAVAVSVGLSLFKIYIG
jgi:hypothetical protein